MNIKLNKIHTVQQYESALKELETLWESAYPGTPDGERFTELADMLEEYERLNFSIEG